MQSLTPKKIDGQPYYYARYCKRVDGKPKIVRTVYLGRIEDLVATTEAGHQPPQPQQTVVAAFGDVAALWHIAGRLQVLPLLDSTRSPPSAIRASLAASTCSWRPSTASSPPPASCTSPTGIARRRSPACSPPTRPGSPRKTSGTIWTRSPPNTWLPLRSK